MDTETNKTPIWQWVVGLLGSLIIGIASYALIEARLDTKATREATSNLAARVAVIEKQNDLQYAHINERQREIMAVLDKVMISQKDLSEILAARHGGK